MRPAMEYAYSVWSPLADTHTSHARAPAAPRFTIQSTASVTYTTQAHNILQHFKRLTKNTIFDSGRYTADIPTDPHAVTAADIKTNMRPTHTYIVSRYIATRGNNKLLRTSPPHISSSEERPPRLTRRTIARLGTSKSPFLKSSLHRVDAKSPLCPLCDTHTHDTHHLFNFTHIRTTLSPLDLGTDPTGVMELLAKWRDMLAGEPKAG